MSGFSTIIGLWMLVGAAQAPILQPVLTIDPNAPRISRMTLGFGAEPARRRADGNTSGGRSARAEVTVVNLAARKPGAHPDRRDHRSAGSPSPGGTRRRAALPHALFGRQ